MEGLWPLPLNPDKYARVLSCSKRPVPCLETPLPAMQLPGEAGELPWVNLLGCLGLTRPVILVAQREVIRAMH